MQRRDEPTFAQARAIRARGLAMPPEGPPPEVILDSWTRCLDSGLAPNANLQIPVVQSSDLNMRRERSAYVRRLAQAELETLSRQIAGSNFLLAFADSEGVILDLYADNRFTMCGDEAGILPGSMWSEGVAGTNGLGTALATQSAVAVTGLEHYFLKLGDISCTAAPVRDALGQVVGVLDASSYYESRQRHTQALVQMAATHIENGLLAHQMQGQLVLAFHPRAEYLGTLSAGLLAFDGDGRLQAVNAPGRHLLTGLTTGRGTRFEELFREPLEHVMGRLHLGNEVRLRDALGSALVVRMVGRLSGTDRRLHVPHGLVQGQPVPKEANRASARVQATPAQADTPKNAPAFLMQDPAVQQACRLVQAAVRMGVPILLHGETGTGKEMLARHAHQASQRTGQFVAVNCAAMPAELFEAELFGYAAGAFTGARREGSPGLIAAADGGTLLLDEIGDLPLPLQAALLRFLDDRIVRPVGGHQSRSVDVQLLAATHTNLDTEVQERRFREDLLYRLNTVRVTLPALRDRADLPEAARWVLHAIDPTAQLLDDAWPVLQQHRWPGNFRELRNTLTRALLNRVGNPAHKGPAQLGAACIQAVLGPVQHGLAAGQADPTSPSAQSGPSALQRNAA